MTTKKEASPYLNHRAGSRKGDVHKMFNTGGEAKAYELGGKLKLGEATLRQWINTWKRNRKAAAKKTTKAAVNKATPRKASTEQHAAM
jgi:transposase